MINPWSIKKFLLLQPRATVIRLTTSDGGQQEIKPGGKWTKVADTIAAIAPDLIECVDAEGRLLRAIRPDQELSGSDAAAVPKELQSDPEALMLTHFANLLHRAYEHSTEVAFSRMLELVERMNDRSDSIETRLERTEARYRKVLEDQIEEALDRAEEAAERAAADATATGSVADIGQVMMTAFQSGARAKAAAPNGAGKA